MQKWQQKKQNDGVCSVVTEKFQKKKKSSCTSFLLHHLGFLCLVHVKLLPFANGMKRILSIFQSFKQQTNNVSNAQLTILLFTNVWRPRYVRRPIDSLSTSWIHGTFTERPMFWERYPLPYCSVSTWTLVMLFMQLFQTVWFVYRAQGTVKNNTESGQSVIKTLSNSNCMFKNRDTNVVKWKGHLPVCWQKNHW